MSSMSSTNVRARMTHRAAIERNMQGTRDAYGSLGPPSWASHIASLPCFFYAARSRSGEEERQPGVVVQQELRMILPWGSDVTERDRVNGITKPNGAVIYAGYLNIASVTPHHTHLEARLEAVA